MIQPVGYFKIWRELFNKPIWLNSTPEQKTILITLLAMANFKEKKWEWQGKPFECQPGQFITSLANIAKECGKGVAIKNVRTAIERFENLEFLANESTKTGRLITVLNWEDYQGDIDEGGKDTGKDRAKTGQRPGKQQAPREEGKEGNKVKKDIYSGYTSNSDLLKAFEDFEAMRNKIKKPMSDRAREMFLTELDKLANTEDKKIAIIEQSIFNNWKGIFPLKQDKPQQKQEKGSFTSREYDGKKLESSWLNASKS